MGIVSMPAGNTPADADDAVLILTWFEDVEKLQLDKSVVGAILQRLVRENIIPWRPSKRLPGLPQWATPVNKHAKS
jgi:hypothetical protein